MAQDDMEGFASKLALLNGSKEENQLQALSSELKTIEIRSDELDKIIEQLYEDKVTGSLSDSRFQKLSTKYETEQSDIKK